MEPEKYATIGVKADAVFNISRTNEYCEPRYSVQGPDRVESTKTGHLEIFLIAPLSPGTLPSFSARWDSKKNTIDIDLIGPRTARLWFKFGLRGYQGHHPVTVSASPRIFHLNIWIPNRRVYEADVSCNVNIAAKLSDNMGQYFSDSVDRILR